MDILSYKKVVSIYKTFSVLNIVFITGAVVVLLSHVLFSRGLDEDSTVNLLYLIGENEIYFFEDSRLFFHFLYQLPLYLLLQVPFITSISFLSQAFSFSLIAIHILSLIICWLILPKDKKQFIFFPLFGFFVGPVTALGISISVSLLVCSYVYMTAFFIHYSDLSKKTHKFLFILIPIPLFLSHELMSYMAWPLIGLCWWKKINKPYHGNNYIIYFLIGFLIFLSFMNVNFLFPENDAVKANLDSFMRGIVDFHFLFSTPKNEGNNIPLYIVIIVLLLMLIQIIKTKISVRYFIFDFIQKILFVGLIFLACFLFFIAPLFFHRDLFLPVYEYSNRAFAPLVGLPISLLIWWMAEIEKTRFNLKILSLSLCYNVFLSCSLESGFGLSFL